MPTDYDINNPNDYIPEPPVSTLPPSAIGKGGLSAISIAGRGSNAKPNLGGLVTGGGQADLETLLYDRVRNGEQLASAKGERRGGLERLQQALAKPENDYSGIENIARGLASNDQPWDVGAGFRKGVAGAFAADAAKQKLARDSGIESASQEMKFNSGEEKIDDTLETNALNNLAKLAKPVRPAGAGGAGGVRFKSVPGVGLIDTQDLDADGKPKVLYADGKLLTDARKNARKIAEAQAVDQQNNITFNSDAEKEAWIVARTDQVAAAMLADTVPGQMSGVTGKPAIANTGGAVPLTVDGVTSTGGKVKSLLDPNTSYDIKELTPEKFAIFQPDAQRDILNSMKAAGKDISKLVPLDQTLSPDGSKPLAGPEIQKGKTVTAEQVAKTQAEGASALKANAETGANLKSTVAEISQLKFNPGMFVKWKQTGGNLLDAFGKNGPLVQMAAQSSNAEALIQAVSNARISLEKGVQTRDDEIRFKNELAKITDPRDAFNYMIKHMNELGDKSIEHYNFVEKFRQSKGGASYDGADQAWQKRDEERGGMVKRYQGSFIGRSEFIDHMVADPGNVKAYGGDVEKLRARAEKEWRALGGK